jgi:hypothetical protein
MATKKTRPPREWRIDDLMDLGKREGDKANHLKAVPVLILERWVQGERAKDVANYVWTKELAKRVEDCGLVSFKPKGSGILLIAPIMIQNSRNLTRPPLIENKGPGMFRISLPHYEPLLQEYRRWYRDAYPQDYKKLFPSEEPSWETPFVESGKPAHDIQPESAGIIQVLEHYDRTWQHRLDESETTRSKLQEEIDNLRKEIENLRKERERRTQPHSGIVDETLRSRLVPLGSSPLDTLIREAGVVLEDRLRTHARAGSTNFGKSLVDEVLNPRNGTLVFSSHEGEREGVYMLFRGAMQFIRNPPMHRLIEYHEDTAALFIRLIDSLLSLLAEGEVRQNR